MDAETLGALAVIVVYAAAIVCLLLVDSWLTLCLAYGMVFAVIAACIVRQRSKQSVEPLTNDAADACSSISVKSARRSSMSSQKTHTSEADSYTGDSPERQRRRSLLTNLYDSAAKFMAVMTPKRRERRPSDASSTEHRPSDASLPHCRPSDASSIGPTRCPMPPAYVITAQAVADSAKLVELTEWDWSGSAAPAPSPVPTDETQPECPVGYTLRRATEVECRAPAAVPWRQAKPARVLLKRVKKMCMRSKPKSERALRDAREHEQRAAPMSSIAQVDPEVLRALPLGGSLPAVRLGHSRRSATRGA